MIGLAIKDVEFNGATLRAAQDSENIIWVGVAWVCQGLGLTKGQMQNERKKIQTDEVLSQGERNFVLPTEGGNQESLCIKLDFLPLWLAKIHITPTMKRENPQLVENLITYQLKAKDVLAEAFLYNNKEETTPSVLEYERKIDRLESKIDKMYEDMGTLAKMFLDWKETADKRTLPVVTDRNTSWKSIIYEKMDRICANTTDFEKRADVMKWIYRYMNKNYGVVWDQEVREYKERNKTYVLPSTIDVVQDKPIIKSIFESVLADLEYKYCHKPVVEGKKTVKNWSDQVIAPLLEKYNDHSNAGMVTYRRVYKKMDENNKIGWKNLTTRYINEHGRKPSRKDLIETRPSLRKKFQNAVKELMEEKEGE